MLSLRRPRSIAGSTDPADRATSLLFVFFTKVGTTEQIGTLPTDHCQEQTKKHADSSDSKERPNTATLRKHVTVTATVTLHFAEWFDHRAPTPRTEHAAERTAIARMNSEQTYPTKKSHQIATEHESHTDYNAPRLITETGFRLQFLCGFLVEMLSDVNVMCSRTAVTSSIFFFFTTTKTCFDE